MSKAIKTGSADAIFIDAITAVHHIETRLPPNTLCSKCEYAMRSNRLPAVVENLRHEGFEGSWAVFMFRTSLPSEETIDDVLNLQYSVEGGIVGLDWILIGPRNCVDKEALTDFAFRRGHNVDTREMNGVAYLRVEDGDIAKLGLDIVSDFYRVDSDYVMGLLVQGFCPPSNLDSNESS